MSANNAIPRRKFLSQAAAAAAVTIVPRHVLGRGFVSPSDMLHIAGIGVGGMGRANLINLASQNIVALCDVDCGDGGKIPGPPGQGNREAAPPHRGPACGAPPWSADRAVRSPEG